MDKDTPNLILFTHLVLQKKALTMVMMVNVYKSGMIEKTSKQSAVLSLLEIQIMYAAYAFQVMPIKHQMF